MPTANSEQVIIAAIVALSCLSCGCRSNSHLPLALPSFEAYPVADAGAEKYRYRRPLQRVSRTELPERGLYAYENGSFEADFAGLYKVISWGCGSPCQMHAVINIETSEILGMINSAYGGDYRLDSRLLLIDPREILLEYREHGLVNETRAYAIRQNTLYEIGSWAAW